jgi:hypothetical protein
LPQCTANVADGSCVTSNVEVGNQVLISSHRKLLSSKAMVVNVAEKSEQDSGTIERGERKRTAAEVSKCD